MSNSNLAINFQPGWTHYIASFFPGRMGARIRRQFADRDKQVQELVDAARVVMYSNEPPSKALYQQCLRVLDESTLWFLGPETRSEVFQFFLDALSRTSAQLSSLTGGKVSKEEINRL